MALVKLNNRGVRSATTFGSISALGEMRFIKKQTASASSDISFVDGTSDVVLDDTYKEYLFTFNNIHGATQHEHFTFNMSIDSGSNYNVTKTTTYFHAANNEGDSATEAAYQGGSDLAQSTDFHRLANFLNIENDGSCSGYLHIFNPSSTTFVKHFISRFNSMSYTSDPYSLSAFTSGYGNTTSAVDVIQFKQSSGNIDAGDICLYGIN